MCLIMTTLYIYIYIYIYIYTYSNNNDNHNNNNNNNNFVFRFFIFNLFQRRMPASACIIISLLNGEVTVKFERFNLAF